MMARSEVFDELSASLVSTERQALLRAVRESLERDESPIYVDEDPVPPPADMQLKLFSFWDRVRLWVVQLLTARTREEVIRGWSLKTMRSRVVKQCGDVVDLRRSVFRDGFAADLQELGRALRRISSIVGVASNARTEFILALVEDRLPTTHAEVVRVTSDQYLAERSEKGERFLKREAAATLEQLLVDMSAEGRKAVRNATAHLDRINRLVAFPFDTVVARFRPAGDGETRECPFSAIVRDLESLTAEVAALTAPTDLRVYEIALLVSTRDERARGVIDDVQEGLRARMQRVTAALARLRRFVARYPLTALVRVISDDPWWEPRMIAGGEDWAALYRAFFFQRIDRQVLRISLGSQAAQQMDELQSLVAEDVPVLPGIPEESVAILGSRRYSIAAVLTFAGYIWRRAMPNLRIILNDGDFYKSANRAQYNEAFAAFEEIPQRIAWLEDLFRRLTIEAQLPGTNLASSAMEREPVEGVVTLVGWMQTTIELMVNLLTGILYAHAGSTYDTLANLGQLGGRRNAEVIEDLRDTHMRLRRFLGVLTAVVALERRAVENSVSLSG